MTRSSKIILITALLWGIVFVMSILPTEVVAQTPPAEAGRSVPTGEELGFTFAASVVYNVLTYIGALATYLGGSLLDISLSWFVWGMAETTAYFKLDEVIQIVWALVRDLFNLLFIFGLIYIGFQLILGTDDSNSKKTLGTIVVAALLINFSLYIAQVVVDFGNIVSTEMARQFQPTAGSEVLGRPVFNIADSFVSATSLDQLSSSTLKTAGEAMTGRRDIPHEGIGVGQALVIGLMVSLMLIIVGFVLAAGAFLMFARFIYLIFLMMFSPIMFLGMVLPQFKSYTNDWWKRLINQVLIGPAYLFMLYISLLALKAFADTPSDQGIMTFMMLSLIVSAFAWASLMAAKNFGAVGATTAMKWGESMGRYARGAATGFAGRHIVGRGANAAQESFNRWQARPEEEQSRVGRWLRRGVALTNLDQTVTNITDRGRNARFGGGTSFQQADERNTARERRLRAGADEQRNETRVNQTSQNLTRNPVAVTSNEMRDFTNSIRNLTNRQLTEDITFETLTNHNVAINLSDAQIDTIRNSGRFNNQQIAEIRQAREAGFTNLAQGNPGPHNVTNQHRTTEWLSQRSIQQMAQMPAAVFIAPQMAQYITPPMIDARLREGGINNNDLQSIRNNLQNYLNPQGGAQRPQGAAAPTQQTLDNWRNWSQRSAFANRLGLIL